jgi:uncharacterized protein YjbJ (UPF0337 family)
VAPAGDIRDDGTAAASGALNQTNLMPERSHGLESRGRQLEASEGKVKEQWGKLTDDELDQIKGQRDQLEGKIQERYGIAKDQAKKDVDNWYNAQKW